MADYRVGRVDSPTVPIAVAVAASAAFPPFLSPLELELDPDEVKDSPGADLHLAPFTSQVVLTDGGVYDNLGLETVWKRYRTVLVSDGGGDTGAEGDPKRDWLRHTYRVLNLIDDQVRALRKKQVVDSYCAPAGRPEPPSGRVLGHPGGHRQVRARRRASGSVRKDDRSGEHGDAPQGAARRPPEAPHQLGLRRGRRRDPRARHQGGAGAGLALPGRDAMKARAASARRSPARLAPAVRARPGRRLTVIAQDPLLTAGGKSCDPRSRSRPRRWRPGRAVIAPV